VEMHSKPMYICVLKMKYVLVDSEFSDKVQTAPPHLLDIVEKNYSNDQRIKPYNMCRETLSGYRHTQIFFPNIVASYQKWQNPLCRFFYCR